MTIDRETVIRLARDAGAEPVDFGRYMVRGIQFNSDIDLEKFAALVLEQGRKTQLCEIGDAFERCIPTRDGRVLAAMIREGVTALDSHIRHACGRVPLTDAVHVHGPAHVSE